MVELKHRYRDRTKTSDKATLREALTEWVANKEDLSGADLEGADLAGADLAGADLAAAYLVGANLAGANLAGANLAAADLEGANLAAAYLVGADLEGDSLIDAGQDACGYRFVAYQRDGVRVTAGCRDFTLAEAGAHWANNPECAAKIALIEAVAKQRGWLAVKEQAAIALQ